MPHTPRLRTANSVFFSPSRRMRSEIPSSILPHTARVASGVTSRAEIPVPPVVATNRALRASSTIAFWIAAWSSATTRVSITEKWCCSNTCTTAGPDTSLRSPRAQESLMVSTAARKVSGIEEDIFLFLGLAAAIASRFIQPPQTFHQQSLSVESGGLLFGLPVEVNLKTAASPAQDFEHRGIAFERAIGGMRNLAFAEIHLALFAFIAEREQAAFTPHLKRLHKINDVHLREITAHHAV